MPHRMILKVINYDLSNGMILFADQQNKYSYWIDPKNDTPFRLNECVVITANLNRVVLINGERVNELINIEKLRVIGEGTSYYPDEASEIFLFIRESLLPRKH